MQPFVLTCETHGDSAAVVLGGELDVATAPRVRSMMSDLIAVGVRHVELDLAACGFADSCGLGALMWSAHRIRSLGGDLVAVRVPDRILTTMELAGIRKLVSVRS